MDAAQYKHAVLGLLFIKYVSDAFDIRREELKTQFSDENHDYFFDPDDFESKEEYGEEIMAELEQRDYYTEKNVFWVPFEARWNFLQDNNKSAIGGAKILIEDGKVFICPKGLRTTLLVVSIF